jgi:hypothetical protein
MANQDAVETREQELAEYLQERIKPGLNRGAIPLLARSIAKEIARGEHLDGGSDDDDADDERDDEPALEAADDAEDERDDEPDDEVEGELDDERDDEPEDELDDERDDEPEDELDDERDDEPDDEVDDEREDESTDEADRESNGDSESPVDEFEAEMHELQAELGEDWILRFSVQGGDAWLTAEKQDGSQHVEGPSAEVLLEAVELLNEGDQSG